MKVALVTDLGDTAAFDGAAIHRDRLADSAVSADFKLCRFAI